MPPIGNPQDILTTPYGYAGQMAPETAVAEQQLNRRRLIANMLMQNGMQKPQGRMVGRFFVGPNPLEHVANLAQAGVGAYLTNDIDSKSKDLMTQDRQSVVDAIKAYQDSKKPDQFQSPAQSSGMPSLPPQALPSEPGQALPPRPDGPYSGQVGAAAMPDEGVQSAQPPVHPQPPSSIAGQDSIQGMDMGKAAPADMGQMVQPPPATPAQPMPTPALAPTSQPPVRFVEPPAKKTTMDDLAGLMTHQHPQVRAYGQMLAQQMQQEKQREDQQSFLTQEKETQREFTKGENALNRDTQRELVGSKLDQAMMMGLISKEQKDQMMAQAERQNQLSAEIKKAEIGSRTTTAKQHDETLKAIAQMNMEGRKDIAGMKAGSKDETKLAEQEKSKKDVEGIIAVLRDSYQQLRTGGGVTDTEKGGLTNAGAAASSSGIGQALGKTFGTQNQSHRNTIAQQRPILMGNISKALGMSAKQLDSNAELKLWLNAATDPTLDYQTNMRALDQLESMLGGSAGAAAQAAPAPVGGPKAGTVEDGYRFKGGNPSDPKSWEKVQ